MKTIRTKISGLLRRLFTYGSPHGACVFHDIKKKLPFYQPKVFFDVGANLGQSAKQILHWFPKAKIYCFEPVNSTFLRLLENLIGYKNVFIFRLALGSANCSKDILIRRASGLNSFLPFPEEFSDGHPENIEPVDLRTLSSFCLEKNVQKIDFLKIDTEGYDLEVLKGGESMLDLHQISFIQVEAGINSQNKKHIQLAEFKEYMETRGYFLFGLYEQALQKPDNFLLRRCNAVFVSQKALENASFSHKSRV